MKSIVLKLILAIMIIIGIVSMMTVSKAVSVLLGDVNEDGKITTTDVAQLKSHLVEIKFIEEAKQKIADINRDGKISMTDLILVKDVILGEADEVSIYLQSDEIDEPIEEAADEVVDDESDEVVEDEPDNEDVIDESDDEDIEELVNVKYVTDPNLYPDGVNEKLSSMKKKAKEFRVSMKNDLQVKEYSVSVGSNFEIDRTEVSISTRIKYDDHISYRADGSAYVYIWRAYPKFTNKWLLTNHDGVIKELGSGEKIEVDEDITLYAIYSFQEEKDTEERPDYCIIDPYIYFYPEEETQINVKYGFEDRLVVTFPEYEAGEGWNIMARPDGKITDLKTREELEYIMYIPLAVKDMKEEGFVVKGEDSEAFLNEKLEILGLNEKESTDFMESFLPKLEANKYNFIRFSEMEYLEENLPLEITPKPDSLIRVFMEFKGLEEKIEVKEQKLVRPERFGYVVAEWGGTEL